MARTVRRSHLSSVCRLPVTLLHPKHTLELFGNILHRLIAQGLEQFVLKFWTKLEGFLWDRAS